MRLLVVGMIVLFSFMTSAQARHHHRHHSARYGADSARPARWCGWYMRQQVGHDPGPAFNVARMWAHYGSNAGGPYPGTIVVWPHHVGIITGFAQGQQRWVVRSGNDGHAVRERPHSLRGAIAFRTFGFN